MFVSNSSVSLFNDFNELSPIQAGIAYTISFLPINALIARLVAGPVTHDPFYQLERAYRSINNPILRHLAVGSRIMVVAPVIEETIFRLGLNNALTAGILKANDMLYQIAPESLQDYKNEELDQTVAQSTAAVASSLAFAWIHKDNDEIFGRDIARAQIVLSTIYGVGLALLQNSKGFSAALAAHVTNNVISYLSAKLQFGTSI